MDDYPARSAYQNQGTVARYETARFSSWFGRYVFLREQKAVNSAIKSVGSVRSILDCPSGIGRWHENLQTQLVPEVLVSADISVEMLLAGRRSRPGNLGVLAEAERLPFASDSFDLVFCHALTKHLPTETQALVLSELARVSRRHVICSFSLDEGIPGALGRYSSRRGRVKSRAISARWLEENARIAGLEVVSLRSCTSHLGRERTVVLRKI